MSTLSGCLGQAGPAGAALRLEDQGSRGPFDKPAPRLARFAPELHHALAGHLREPKDPKPAAARLEAFLADVPEGYYPPERFVRTLERVRAQDVEGIVIFSSGGITLREAWVLFGTRPATLAPLAGTSVYARIGKAPRFTCLSARPGARRAA